MTSDFVHPSALIPIPDFVIQIPDQCILRCTQPPPPAAMASRPSKPPNRKLTEDAAAPSLDGRILSARRDTLDFQDLMKGPGRAIREFALYTLNDSAERDDHCARIYNKSLLYLVSNAFEEEYHPLKWGWPGAPILGMEKHIKAYKEIRELFNNKTATWILSPNSQTTTLKASKSTSHGGFDDDKPTVKGTLARILGSSTSSAAPIEFKASASSSKDQRSGLSAAVS
jgi:hypothetical protein